MVYLVIPEGRNLVGFEVTLVNIPGALHELTSIIFKHELNIYYIETCSHEEKEYTLFIAVDFAGKNTLEESLLNEFRENIYIKEVSVSPRIKNILYPSRYCPMDLGGIRAILFGEANMRGLINGLKRELKGEVARTILFRLGFEVGRDIYELYVKNLGITNLNEAIELLNALMRGARWLNVREYSIDKDKIILKVSDSWECNLLRNEVNSPASNYIKGIIMGFFKEFLNTNVEIEETKCIAAGDPYCEFILSYD